MSAEGGASGPGIAERQAPASSLFQLSFPLFLHSVAMFAVVLLDTMIVSHHALATAAAVQVANQVAMVAFEVSALLGVGAVILIAHALGRGDAAAAREIAAVAVAANTLLGVAAGLLLAVAGPPLVTLLDTPDAIAGEAQTYLRVVAAAMGFNGYVVAATACLRGFGRSRTVLALGLFAAVFYLVAELVLVLGAGPIPAFGTLGSALGTLATRVAAALTLALVLLRGLGVGFDLHLFRHAGRRRIAAQLVSISLPSVADNIAYGGYQIVLLGLVTGHGVAAVLARGYVMIALAFLTLVVMAVSHGNEVLIGWLRGAGGTGTVQARALRSAAIAAIAATAVAALLHALAGPFLGLFTDDPAVHALGRELLFLTILLQPGFAVNTILFHSLKAVGDTRWPAVVSQATTWCVGLPLAVLLSSVLGCGVAGIWYALILEEALKAVFMLLRWQGRSWQRRVLFEPT
ncbi:MATE family efflux transporter [Methylobrevis pamukkalensis]|uniref:Multidrug resistance protein MdtK n=1 Tax=Methylobrevis pamukkalensis TaxID=1439726 RepID=A0A1E3H7Q3_9HYPH|nr:MATE family efflux transporter [Methylobrevis pamukkalensis]ODN72185.1 Multidrug resistance protein MdtK [Methylobrevis pamukkalensis]